MTALRSGDTAGPDGEDEDEAVGDADADGLPEAEGDPEADGDAEPGAEADADTGADGSGETGPVVAGPGEGGAADGAAICPVRSSPG
jgi:hypothetical protein